MITYEHDETGVTIHHNGDYSGEALIHLRQRPEIRELHAFDGQVFYEIEIPCAPLAQFSRWATLSEVTRVLEDMQ
jgi:hypothetical protein